jgi:four helix bundle protein
MQDFRKLRITDYVRALIVRTYKATETFPKTEMFGLVSQMRRAAVGIGSNIAEGCGRSSNAAFRVSLDRASGEGSELEFQCVTCLDLALGEGTAIRRLLAATVQVRKMLSRLIVAVRKRHLDNDDEGRRPGKVQRPNVPTSQRPKPAPS